MRKLALIILDGWGIGEEKPNNAIYMAKTPFFDHLWKNYPHTQLQASGEYVGLPEGQIGGSEVGHLTIGAGRVMYQQLPRINKSIESAENSDGIMNIKNFTSFLEMSKHKTTHLIGLISPGGVHSHENHLIRLLTIMKQFGSKPPIIHFITDGRDTSPTSGLKSAHKLIKHLREMDFGTIATLSGRFYAMDRDRNMDRTSQAIKVVKGKYNSKPIHHTNRIKTYETLVNAISNNYNNKTTDEFITPTLIDQNYPGTSPDDIMFFFNFRSDRMKQLITELEKATKIPHNHFFTMTKYDKSYPYKVIFEKETISDTIGEVLSKLNLKQLKAAETEKAPHVTYFFNGGVEQIFQGELRTVAESNKVRHDQLPEMKSAEIHKNIVKEVMTHHPEFILVNFANPDMVGHTGNFKAVVRGVESVDHELKSLCKFLSDNHYICLITADHGNADIMYDLETKEPHTAHTLNPVPFVIYDPIHHDINRIKLRHNPSNGLSLIAGTALELMEIPHKHEHFQSLVIKK